MGRAIAVCNQKGGVGKSTTAVNVGAYMAVSGAKTLLIDLDPQGNATTACGIKRAEITHDAYDVLVEKTPLSDAVINTSIDRLDLIPSSIDLAGAESHLVNVEEKETCLKTACEPAKERYDVILFDCPPSLGLLTINALVAAESTLIPVQCEYLALEGVSALLKSIALIKQRLNPELRVGGIVLTMTDGRTNLSREVSEELKRFFKDRVFETAIPRNIRLAESPSFGKPICLYDPHSAGALAYDLLTKEVMIKEGILCR